MVDGIRAHVGGGAGEAASAIGAQAYTTGNSIAFASPPDLGLAAHEAAHVVQQAGGVQLKAGGGGNLFETTALGLEGTDQGTYFGSVKWGYVLNGSDVDIKDIELASMGVPTQNYLAAADLWNKTKTRGTYEVTANPAKAKKASDMSDVDVAQGTKVRYVDVAFIAGKIMTKVAAVTGGAQYYINVTDLKDTQDGGDTVDVPVPGVFVNPTGTGLFSDEERKTKVKDLPANTRMEVTPGAGHGSSAVKIVDGADVGVKGFVEQAKIKSER